MGNENVEIKVETPNIACALKWSVHTIKHMHMPRAVRRAVPSL